MTNGRCYRAAVAAGRHRRGSARVAERPQPLRHLQRAGAVGKHIAQAKQSNSSQLGRELADIHGTGFGLTSSPGAFETETLAALRSAKAALASKAPDELDSYRQFVVEVAQSVADAAGGGETAERAAIEKINSALR
jgi:hypothetical protein